MGNEGRSSSEETVRDAPQVIGACSWSLQPISPRMLAESLDACGISCVQLALLPLVEDPRVWTDAVPVLSDHGIRVISGMFATLGEDYGSLESIRRTGGVRPDETWPKTLELAIRVADLAQELKIELITFHAGFIPHEAGDPVREAVLERLRTLATLFSERGIGIGLETGQETAATLLDALVELDCPGVGVNFDPANMILYGMGDPVEALRMLGPHVVQLHVKDAVATEEPGTWGTEVPVGEGDVDWNGFLEVVTSLPREIDLVIEREAGDRRISDIEQARVMLESWSPSSPTSEGSA